MIWNTPELIPQFLEPPVSEELFRYKASSGSYKAADFVLKLFEFTALAIIDGDPLNDISVTELEGLLRARLPKPITGDDPITVASRSAWPESKNGIVVVEAKDIKYATENLCIILESESHENLVSRLIIAHEREEAEGHDYVDLGLNFESMGIGRHLIEANPEFQRIDESNPILEAYFE